MNGSCGRFMNWETVTVCLAGVMVIARQELEGFPQSGYGVLGPEQARLAAEDRVDELDLMDRLLGPTWCDWRSVPRTQLLRRLTANTGRPAPRVASTDTKVSPIPSSN